MLKRCPDFANFTAQGLLEQAEKQAVVVRERLATYLEKNDTPTFANTILFLEHLDDGFREVVEDFFYLFGVHATPDYQKLAGDMGLLATQVSNDIALSAPLFRRIKAVYEGDQVTLSAADRRLLEKVYRGFVRSGAALDETGKSAYRRTDERLTELGNLFSQNLLASTNELEFAVEDESQVKGLPAVTLAAAREKAETAGRSGWLFGGDQATAAAILAHSPSSDLRRQVAEARARRATSGPYDNRAIILEIAKLRQEKATLLGYPHWTAYQLAMRMAGDFESVQRIFSAWEARTLKAVRQNLADIANFSGIPLEAIQSWDYPYFVERYQEQHLQLSEAEVRPYFPVDHVIPALFALLGDWYGLTFERVTDIKTYHPTVEVYTVKKNHGSDVGVLYVDLYARPEKRSGAWMSDIRPQEYAADLRVTPVVGIALNLTLPTGDEPACLTHDELITLLHEMGHALHGLLSSVPHRSIAGTNVSWDFVELPSQFTENFAYEPFVLAKLSRHLITKESLPVALAQKIADSLTFQAGVQFARQLAFVQLDFSWHLGGDLPSPDSLADFEAQAMSPYVYFPAISGGLMSTTFSHIWAGGYSAGYYSYRWAEMLDADAFIYAKTSGFSPDVFQAFEAHILQQGDSHPPQDLYRAFRGQEPNPEALLLRLGL
jgi:Zn-dependent oligopeptidase